jgi:arylsulfatase A-like enzyme
MTGRYAYHTGMTSNQTGLMMPRMLKPAGYVTAQCGKWAQLPLQPGDWGFDEYLRFQGSGKYWNTQKNAKTYTLNGKEVPLRDGEYLPDRMHSFVVDFITRHKDQPFYVYYAMSHVHGQILPTPDTAPGTKDQFKIYQDNVTYMDKLVGKLIAELDRLKLRENTLILFAGDSRRQRHRPALVYAMHDQWRQSAFRPQAHDARMRCAGSLHCQLAGQGSGQPGDARPDQYLRFLPNARGNRRGNTAGWCDNGWPRFRTATVRSIAELAEGLDLCPVAPELVRPRHGLEIE